MNCSEIYKALSITPTAFAKAIPFAHAKEIAINDQKKTKPVVMTTENQTTETTTEDEARRYKHPLPTFVPDFIKNNELSSEDQLRLDYYFRLAKSALHEFKNLLCEAGIDTSQFDVRITNNRLDFSKIPNQYRSAFETLLKYHLSAQSFKARGTHRSLFHPFVRQLLNDHVLNKQNNLLHAKDSQNLLRFTRKMR